MHVFPRESRTRSLNIVGLAIAILLAIATPPKAWATGSLVTVSPGSLSFGTVALGSKVTRSVVVTNLCVCVETVSSVELIGSGFLESGPSLPVQLSSGKTLTLTVTFEPVSAGNANGYLVVYPWAIVPLTGTGGGATLDQLSVSPALLNFGSVSVGGTATDTAVLKAIGQAVTVSSVASSNSQFATPGLTLPLKIPAGQSLSIKVTFTPKAAGTASGSLTFVNNASNSHAAESVTGTATTTMPYVVLSWNRSTSAVAGYNVYRSTSRSGPFSRRNYYIDTGTKWTDRSVAAKTTYFYATTAVSPSGEESGYSNIVEVQIP
jgi:hypothetical protein